MTRWFRCGLLLITLTGSASVLAHYPTMECNRQGQALECRVGYSDGSKAVGDLVRLYNYDEQLLAEKAADQYSRASFLVPTGEFYIQFDSGHEFPVEVDYGEL